MTVEPMPPSDRIRFGAPVSFEDFQRVTTPVYNFAYALDTRDWALMRTSFADTLSIDTSAAGNASGAGPLSAEEFVWNVKISETGFEGTELLMGNPQVAIEGDRAFMRVAFYGEHIAATADGDNYYTIGGYQDWRLTRTGEGWKIDGFRLRPLWTKGNRNVMNVGVNVGAQRLKDRGDPPPLHLQEKMQWK